VEAQKTTVPQAADTLDPALATEELNLLYWEQQYAGVVTAARKIIESGRATENIHILLGRSLANQGKSAEAGRATAEALESFPESAELHYLHSVLLLESGRPSEAAVAARRALYLRPDLALAHLAFADAALKNGNRSDGRRALRNAERLLAKLPPEETIAAADGETAARLLRIAQFRLKLLEDEAVPNG
jgi:tetratricopeptide (TPR) repeat protein